MKLTLRPALWPAALLCAGFAFSGDAAAQSIQPGLWEMHTRMTHSNKETQQAMAQMQQQLASMPPAQRKQMEAMLAQQGVSVDGKGGMRMKSCVTPEMAARSEVPVQEGDCKTTPAKRSGNTMKFSYQCTDPDIRGEGTATFTSPKQYSLHSESVQTVNGKGEKITMDVEGTWLSSDCTGAINAPRKK